MNLALPAHWFVTWAPELKLDLTQDGAVFFPFDLTVGKLITRILVASVEFKHKLVDDFPQFDWSVEARLGFFF